MQKHKKGFISDELPIYDKPTPLENIISILTDCTLDYENCLLKTIFENAKTIPDLCDEPDCEKMRDLAREVLSELESDGRKVQKFAWIEYDDMNSTKDFKDSKCIDIDNSKERYIGYSENAGDNYPDAYLYVFYRQPVYAKPQRIETGVTVTFEGYYTLRQGLKDLKDCLPHSWNGGKPEGITVREGKKTYPGTLLPENFTKGTEMVISERNNRIEKEGLTEEKDMEEDNNALTDAAIAHIQSGMNLASDEKITHLAKAAALLIAEIDRELNFKD